MRFNKIRVFINLENSEDFLLEFILNKIIFFNFCCSKVLKDFNIISISKCSKSL